MISKFKALLFLFTLIAFLLSATFGFSSSAVQVFGNDNPIVLMDDDDDKDKEDDDDDDDDKKK